MSLTLTQIRSIVRTLTKEPYPSSPTFATDANTLLFANLAQLELASRTKTRIGTNVPNSTSDPSDLTTSGQRLYSFPSNILEIIKVVVNGAECYPVTNDQLVKMGGHAWWKVGGMPNYYYIEDLSGTRKLGLWYTPTSSSWPIAIWGVKRPTDLSAGADVVDLDERLHLAVAYKTAQAIEEYRREMGNAAYFEKKYEDEILKYMASGMDTNERVPFLLSASPSD